MRDSMRSTIFDRPIKCAIPAITDPMGKYWEQPARELIDVDGVEARMTTATMEKLCRYDSTTPTGVYPGKMWATQFRDDPTGAIYLRWYDVDDDPTKCKLKSRLIVLTDALHGKTDGGKP